MRQVYFLLNDVLNVQVWLFSSLSLEEKKITNQRLQEKLNRISTVGYIILSSKMARGLYVCVFNNAPP